MAEEAKRSSRFVKRRMEVFAQGDEWETHAALAILRRGVGKSPGSTPELWSAVFDGFPEDMMGTGKSPTRAEWAVHTALTLYALHQQGYSPKENCMHREGKSLGIAVRELVRKAEDEARIKRRLDVAATSDGFTELANHLRGLILLLKNNGIALDYGRLTEDLYRYQFPEARDSVRLNWGRDFYRIRQAQDTE